jgi:hypothetical protein
LRSSGFGVPEFEVPGFEVPEFEVPEFGVRANENCEPRTPN